MAVIVEDKDGGGMTFQFPLLQIWRGYQVGGAANAMTLNRMGESILDERDWVGAEAIDSKGRLFELVDVQKTPGIANILRTAFSRYRYRVIRVDRKYRYVRTMTLEEIKEYILKKVNATPDDMIDDPWETSPERINRLRDKRSLADFMNSFGMTDAMSPVDFVLTRMGF